MSSSSSDSIYFENTSSQNIIPRPDADIETFWLTFKCRAVHFLNDNGKKKYIDYLVN